MIVLIQRVAEASVSVEGRVTGAVGRGLLALVCGEPGDTPAVIGKLARKTARLRIFEDEAGRMNRSVVDVGGDPEGAAALGCDRDRYAKAGYDMYFVCSFYRLQSCAARRGPCRLQCVCDGAQGRGAVLPHRRIRRAHARLARQ